MTGLKILSLTATLITALTFSSAVADSHNDNTAKALNGLEFVPIGELPIEIAVLWGNPQEGESAVMLKFPPNFPGGMHLHTNSYHGVVVSGGSKHWVGGETEANAPLQLPGDYWYQKGGQVHQDSFPTDAETILFLQFEGPLDTTFVE